MNNKPSQNTPILNSGSGENLSQDNLTVYTKNLTDLDKNQIEPFFDWRDSGDSLAVLNMLFVKRVDILQTGAVEDLSSYCNNGTLGGGMEDASPAWQDACVFGGCYRFDGEDDYVRVDSTVLQSGNTATFTEWFKLDGPGDNSWNRLLNIQDGSNGDAFGLLWDEDDDRYGVFSPSGGYTARVSNDPSLGEWHHWAGVIDNSADKVYFYFDGDLKANASVTESWGGQAVSIGKRYDANDQTNGKVDDIHIYNRALSSEQVKQIYEEGKDSLNNQSSYSSTLGSSETKSGEYKAVVTPSDRIDAGETLSSSAH